MPQPSHRRVPSPLNLNKVSTVKSARPALQRKGTSLGHSISKLGSGQPKRQEKDDSQPYEMAASFLNFWYVGYSWWIVVQG